MSSDLNWTKTGIYYYVVVAREEYKEEEILYFQGNYSIKELEKLAIEHVRENTIMEYEDIEDCYVHIDFIFKSETPIKWIYDWLIYAQTSGFTW